MTRTVAKENAIHRMIDARFNRIEEKFYRPFFEDFRMNELTYEEENERDYMPMCSIIWQASDMWMKDKLKSMIDDLQSIGFRVYEDDEEDIYLGIDGYGYSFLDAHWEPLYDLFGFKWHEIK